MSKNKKFKEWFCKQTQKMQEDVIRFVVHNKPRGRKLKDIMGHDKTDITFDLDLVDGQAGEVAFLNIATSGKHEVKRDFKVSETGNIAIEISCRGRVSGIEATKSPYWVYWLSGEQFGDEVAIIITVARLKRIAKTCYLTRGGDDKASTMYLVPLKKLLLPDSEIERLKQNSQVKMFD